VAVLPESATALQRTVAPSLKVTVPTPLGFPELPVTVAVYVSASPKVLGLLPVVLTMLVLVVLVVDVTANLKKYKPELALTPALRAT
jgi:hypothetical protein